MWMPVNAVLYCKQVKSLEWATRDDLQGHFMYIDYHGCSTVDLILASENLLKTPNIHYLSVKDFFRSGNNK